MKYDVVVIGGGPAGMLAAGRAAQTGARVALVDKNKKLGRKLLMTGGGRCNITNAKNNKDFVAALGQKGKFLFSALSIFSPHDVIDFFSAAGVPVKTENNDRVFPVSDSAVDVLDALISYLKKYNVTIYSGAVREDVMKNNKITGLILSDATQIEGETFVVATGGLSYAATGSNGDGLMWAEKWGHVIVPPRPALVSLTCADVLAVKNLRGLSFTDCQAVFFHDDKKIAATRGEIIFTDTGISGPAILNSSRDVGAFDAVFAFIDFFPATNDSEMEREIESLFVVSMNKSIKNTLREMMPERLAQQVCFSCGLSKEQKVNTVTRADRKSIVACVKKFPLGAVMTGDISTAMVTAGGIALSEVDQKTMNSKIVPNIFFAGEVLDIDGPTGGYNLQICWSTGYVAGESAAAMALKGYNINLDKLWSSV